jgi:V/A-type H+-transporting ATPase subunit I
MYEVSILVHKNYFEDLIDSLQESGILEIFDYSDSKSIDSRKIDSVEPPSKRMDVLSEQIMNTNRLIDILENTLEEPKTFMDSLRARTQITRTEVSHRTQSDLIADAKKTLKELYYINDLDNELSSSQNAVNNLILQHDKLNLFEKLKLNFTSFQSTRHIAIRSGITMMPGELQAELLTNLSKDTLENNQYAIYFHPTPEGSEGYISIILVPSSELNNIRRVLAGRYFKELDMTGIEGYPDQVKAKLSSEIRTKQKKIDSLEIKLRDAHRAHFQKLAVLGEELELARGRTQVQSKFGQTSSVTVISGWCLKRSLKKLQMVCDKATEGHVSISYKEPEEKRYDKVPVKLNNPQWARPFEMLTTTFAVPKYNEIDPTVIIGPLFVLFFGIMLGDAGYGITLLIFSFIVYFKLGKYSRTIKTMSYIGIFTGLTTTIIGFIMGTFFGDLIPRFIYGDPDALLYSAQVAGFYLPYDSFRNPMLLFVLSLLIGLVILNLGLILGAVETLRKKSYRSFMTNQLSWFIIQPPAALLIGHSLLKIWVLPVEVVMPSTIILAVGLIILFSGYMGLAPFEITGFLGDWLSFARLIALSLATIGMALTINIIGEFIMKIGSTPITFVVFLLLGSIVLVLAHMINCILQILGAAIHSLRLQYIELFNRCYEGGGTPFKPFHSGRNYSKLKEPAGKSK